jgi:hypothetical protein
MSLSPHKISSKSSNLFKRFALLCSLKVRHFGMAEATRCDIAVTLNGSILLPNLTKIHRPVHKLEGGGTQTHIDRLVI